MTRLSFCRCAPIVFVVAAVLLLTFASALRPQDAQDRSNRSPIPIRRGETQPPVAIASETLSSNPGRISPTPAAEPRELFYDAVDAPESVLTLEADLCRRDPQSLRSRLVSPAAEAFCLDTPVSFGTFDGLRFSLRFDRKIHGETGSDVWIGRVEGSLYSDATFSVRDGVVVGTVCIPEHGIFALRPIGEGIHVFQQIDAGGLDGCEPPPPPLSGAAAPPAEGDGTGTVGGTGGAAAGGGGPVIDVLVVYTSAVRTAYGGTTGVLNLIDSAIAQTNTTYANSWAVQTLRLAHAEEVVYTESGSSGVDLPRLAGKTDGYMDSVHALRTTYGADVVCLIVNTLGNGGLAYIMSTPSSYFESSAFSVVKANQATTNAAFTHEVGHNMGCAHDRQNASQPGAYYYSYGWRFYAGSTQYRTVMAYSPGVRILHFSNPLVTYLGIPTGVVCCQDNGQTLNNTAPIVAAFRAATQVPTSVTVSPSSVTLAPSASQQFTAQVLDQYGQTMTAAVTWSATGGMISSVGLYTAGTSAGTFTVTVTSGSALGTAVVTIPQPVFTSIVVSPAYVPLPPGGGRLFTASGRDQFGSWIALPGPVTWSATSGTITSSGAYTAGSTPGLYTSAVRASYGSVQGTATVRVADPNNLVRGDANGDGAVNILDLNYLVDYFFRGGPPPAYTRQGDANGDNALNILDLNYLVDYFFRGGPPPPP